MPTPGAVFKWLGRITAGLLLVVLLLFGAIHLPITQQWLTRKASGWLSRQTNTTITVEAIRLRLPYQILIQDAFVADRQADTLLFVERLQLGFHLFPLFHRQIQFTGLSLEGVRLNLVPASDSSMNYDFLIQAFSDTTKTKNQQPESGPAPAWQISAPHARIDLRTIDLRYADTDKHLDLTSHLGHLQARINAFDPVNLTGDIERLALSGVRMALTLGKAPAPSTADTAVVPMAFQCRSLSLQNIGLTLHLPDQQLSAYIRRAESDSLHLLRRPDTLLFQSPVFTLEEGRLTYDIPAAKPASGFDYQHINLDSVRVRLHEISYLNQHVATRIAQFAATDHSGFSLKNLEGEVQYSPDSLRVQRAQARSTRSLLSIPEAFLSLPLLQGRGASGRQAIKLRIDESRLSLQDLALFLPALRESPALQRAMKEPIRIRSRLDGTPGRLHVRELALEAWQSRLAVDGYLYRLLSPDSLEMDLEISDLTLRHQALAAWLPPAVLGEGTPLPGLLEGAGRLQGPLGNLTLALRLQHSRPAAPVAAQLRLRGQVQGLPAAERLRYVVDLDTLYLAREELQDYLPLLFPWRDSLPDVFTHGRIAGSRDSVLADLRLEARRPSDTARIHLAGTIDQLQDEARRYARFRIDSLRLPSAFLANLLPDTLLPAYARAPTLLSGRIDCSGRAAAGDLRARLATTAGLLLAEGNWRDSAYQARVTLDSIALRTLIDSTAYDTLIGRELSSFRLDLTADGRGFSIDSTLHARIGLRFRPLAPHLTWQEGLRLEGTVDRRSFRGDLRVDEPGLQAYLQTDLDFNSDSTGTADLQLQLDQLDLYRLRLSSAPLAAGARLEAHTRGRSSRRFNGRLDLRNLQLRQDSSQQRLDSLLLTVDFQPDQKSARLRSDIARGDLQGRFEYPAVWRDIRSLLRSYVDPGVVSPDSLQRDRSAHLAFDLELYRSGILTSGLIPGLKTLQPALLKGAYQGAEHALSFQARLPGIDYRGLQMDSLLLQAGIGRDTLRYQLGFRKLNVLQQFQVVRFDLSGQAIDGQIVNRLSQRDSAGQPRFALEATLQREEEQLLVRFAREALLNYQPWQFSADNRLLVTPNRIQVNDWGLRRGQQRIYLEDRAGKDLIVGFDQLNLSLLANTLKYGSDYVQGILTGRLTLADWREEGRLSFDGDVTDFGILQARLGALSGHIHQRDSQHWQGRLSFRGDGHEFALSADYQPGAKEEPLALQLDAKRIDLASLAPLTQETVDSLRGSLSGRLNLSGDPDHPVITGQLRLDSTALVLHQLKSRWRIDDQRIEFLRNPRPGETGSIIRFQQLTLLDDSRNTFIVDGDITTPDLRSFKLGLDLRANRFTVLNTQKEDNDLYYGRLAIDANGRLTGPLDTASLTVTVAPAAGSRLVYNYPVEEIQSEESGEGIIEFRRPDSLVRAPAGRAPAASDRNPLGWDFTVNLAVNEKLELKIITDPLTGDHFQGKGKGDLSLRLTSNDKITLNGQVEVVEGRYLFTYTELIKRTFTVLSGSTVGWSGDPADPELSVRAQYATKATPYPVVAFYQPDLPPEKTSALRRRQEFAAIFRVDGRLGNLTVSAAIDYPNSPLNTNNSDISAAINQINQDPTQTIQQAFSLLLFNGFLAPGAGGASEAAVVNVQQGLGDLLTNYLNRFAERYVDFVELNVDIESSGEDLGSLENTDVRVQIQKRFLNDRLEVRIDGVATGRAAGASGGETQAYLDNVTVEYALTRDGRLRIKLYNQRDIEDFFGGEVVKLGGALVFSKDFRRWRLIPREEEKETDR